MDRQEAQRNHRYWTRQLDSVRSQIADLSRQEAALLKLIEGIGELFPNLAISTGDKEISVEAEYTTTQGTPRGREAISRVLAANPSTFMTVSEIVEAQAARKWVEPSRRVEDAVRTTLGRMRQAGKVRRRKRGNAYAYQLIKDKLDASQNDSEASSSSLSTERTGHGPALTN